MADGHQVYAEPTSYGADGQPLWLHTGPQGYEGAPAEPSMDSGVQQQWNGWGYQPGPSYSAQPHSYEAPYHQDSELMPQAGTEYGIPMAGPSSYPPGPYLQQPQPLPIFSMGTLDQHAPPASQQTTPTSNNTQMTPQQRQHGRMADVHASPSKKSRPQASPRKSRRKPPADRAATDQPISPGRARPHLRPAALSNPLSPSNSASTTSITRPTTPSSRQDHSPTKGPASLSKQAQRYNPDKQFDNDAHPPLPTPVPATHSDKVLAYEQHLPEPYPMLTPPSDPSASYQLLPPGPIDGGFPSLSYGHLPASGSVTSPYGLYTPDFYPVGEMDFGMQHGLMEAGHTYSTASYPSQGQAGGHGVVVEGSGQGAPQFHPVQPPAKNIKTSSSDGALVELPGPHGPSAATGTSGSARNVRLKPNASSEESEDDDVGGTRKTDEEGAEGNEDEEPGAQFGAFDGEDDFSENLGDCFPWVYKMVMNQQVATNPDGSLRIPRSSNSYMIFRAWTGRQKVRDNLVLDEDTKKSVVRLLEDKNVTARSRLKDATTDKAKKTWQNAIDQNDKRIHNIQTNASGGMPQSCVSVVTSVLWSKTDKEIKKTFAELARYAAELHMQRFPGYKYQPEKKDAKKARLEAMKLAKKAAKESARQEAARLKQSRKRSRKKVKGGAEAPVEAEELVPSPPLQPDAAQVARPQAAPSDIPGDPQWDWSLCEIPDAGTGRGRKTPQFTTMQQLNDAFVARNTGNNVSAMPMELQQHPHIRMMQEHQVAPAYHSVAEDSRPMTAPTVVSPSGWQGAWQDPSYRREDHQTVGIPLATPQIRREDSAASAQYSAGHVELRLTANPRDGDGPVMDAVLVPAQFTDGAAFGDQAYLSGLMGINQDDLAQLDLWALIEADNGAEVLAAIPEGSSGPTLHSGEADYAELVVNDWAELVDTSEETGYADYELSTGLTDRILASYQNEFGHPPANPGNSFDGTNQNWSGVPQHLGAVNTRSQAQDTLLSSANPITPLDGAFPDVFQQNHSLAAQQTASLGSSSGMDTHTFGVSPHALSPTYSTFGDISHRYVSSSAFPLMSGNPMDNFGDAGLRHASTATVVQQPRLISQMIDPADMQLAPPQEETAPAGPTTEWETDAPSAGGDRTSLAARRGRRGRALGQTHR